MIDPDVEINDGQRRIQQAVFAVRLTVSALKYLPPLVRCDSKVEDSLPGPVDFAKQVLLAMRSGGSP